MSPTEFLPVTADEMRHRDGSRPILLSLQEMRI